MLGFNVGFISIGVPGLRFRNITTLKPTVANQIATKTAAMTIMAVVVMRDVSRTGNGGWMMLGSLDVHPVV
jgi:hypothetical protein